MTISVSVKNGRLTVREHGSLVRDGGTDFVQALTDGERIFTLQKDGRVQEIRKQGTLVKDYPGRAIDIELSGDSLFVTTKEGRFEEYVNGRMVRSTAAKTGEARPTAKLSSVKKPAAIASTSHHAEALGEKIAQAALHFGAIAIMQAVRAIKEAQARKKTQSSSATQSSAHGGNAEQRPSGNGGVASQWVVDRAAYQNPQNPSRKPVKLTEMLKWQLEKKCEAMKRVDKKILGAGQFAGQMYRLLRLDKLVAWQRRRRQ